MLPKRQRLTTPLLQAVFKSGKTKQYQYFSLKFLPQKDNVAKFAVVVSNKVEPLSTRRHSLKRKMYQALGKTKMPAGHYVFILKKGASDLSAADFERILESDRIRQ